MNVAIEKSLLASRSQVSRVVQYELIAFHALQVNGSVKDLENSVIRRHGGLSERKFSCSHRGECDKERWESRLKRACFPFANFQHLLEQEVGNGA